MLDIKGIEFKISNAASLVGIKQTYLNISITDNRPTELMAENRICSELLKFKIKTSKPYFDEAGADLLLIVWLTVTQRPYWHCEIFSALGDLKLKV